MLCDQELLGLVVPRWVISPGVLYCEGGGWVSVQSLAVLQLSACHEILGLHGMLGLIVPLLGNESSFLVLQFGKGEEGCICIRRLGDYNSQHAV